MTVTLTNPQELPILGKITLLGRTGMSRSFMRGARDAVPVALGYFAISFTLGLVARRAGLTAFEAAFASLITNTSAGQFAGFAAIAAGSPLMETALTQVVVNLRYVLMSSGLTQRVERDATLPRRLVIAFDVTDELFALGVSKVGPLEPAYYYGMMAATIPCWALGTFLGALSGALLPPLILAAASVALYAMFIAVIAPPAKKDLKVLMLCLIAMALSALLRFLPPTAHFSGGLRVMLVALPVSGVAAFLFPKGKEEARDA